MRINVRDILDPIVIDVRKIMQEAESERFFKELYSPGYVYWDGDRERFVREKVEVLNFDETTTFNEDVIMLNFNDEESLKKYCKPGIDAMNEKLNRQGYLMLGRDI